MSVVTEDKWERCEPNDPNRCQATDATGQCRYKAKEGLKFCIRHSSFSDKMQAKKAAEQYRLTQYQERFTDFTTNSEIKNLRGEIGILRMTLEQVLVNCKTPTELLAYTGKISDLVVKIQKLVQACQRIETQMGMMMDRDKIMIIGAKIVELVSEAVPDKEKLDELGERIVNVILEVSQQ